MKILITGATGVLGRRITKKLVEEKHVVAGLTTSNEGANLLQKLNAKAYVGDIYDKKFIFSMVSEFKPDIIIHQITDLKNMNSNDNANIRIKGTQNIVDAAKKYHIKKIISQSISWAYEPGSSTAVETTSLDIAAELPRKTTIDGIVKLEEQTKQIQDFVILRYGTLYGPDTWYGKDGAIYQQYLQNTEQISTGIANFIHIEDAVNACISAITLPTGIYNIVDDEPASGTIWAPYYAEQISADNTINFVEKKSWERAVSNEKFKEHGGKLIFKTWKEGMKYL